MPHPYIDYYLVKFGPGDKPISATKLDWWATNDDMLARSDKWLHPPGSPSAEVYLVECGREGYEISLMHLSPEQAMQHASYLLHRWLLSSETLLMREHAARDATKRVLRDLPRKPDGTLTD